MLAKKLRLVAAQLTDVGRRRERNQDNVTHFIPEDEAVLEEKGALFIVCDGMGGHAAGEVASELGVAAMRDAYYSVRSSDTISALAQAVDAANQAIYSHAREHPELTGMGTTCVAVAMVGGRAYFVNVGDSRGYLIRESHMRQVTRDHSWVAEQVRVGLLTEDQARSHAHRNVITRSLGTQPTVTADLFVEPIHEGDRVLLCSDGLHGYVEEDQIEREVIDQPDPQATVQRLIDMANANGGPDNITAVVVRMIEVPELVGELTLPGTPEPPAVESATTQPMPATPTAAATAVAIRPELATENAPPTPREKRTTLRRNRPFAARLAIAALQVMLVLVVLAIGGAGWYFFFGPFAQQRAAAARLQGDVVTARQQIAHSSSQDPVTALNTLAQARQRLVLDLANPALDAGSRGTGQTVLTSDLEPAVQQALARYDAAASVMPLSTSGTQSYTVTCNTAGASTALATASALQPVGVRSTGTAPQQALYALSGGQLYQVLVPVSAAGAPVSGNATCSQVTIPGSAAVIALASEGSTLYALVEGSNASYVVDAVTPDATNLSAAPKVETRFSVPEQTGVVPGILAEQGGTFYVSYSGSTSGQSVSGVWIFTGDLTKGPIKAVKTPRPTASLAVTTNTLYVLASDGSLGQIDANGVYSVLSVPVSTPVHPADPSAYTAAVPVPTPQASALATAAQTPTVAATATATDTPTTAPAQSPAATSSAAATSQPTPIATVVTTPPPTATAPVSSTLFPAGSVLAVDPLQPMHLLLGDGTNSRIVRLVASSSGPGLGLVKQYVYGSPITNASRLAITSAGTSLYAFVWNGTRLAAIPLPSTSSAG